jgi:class 3 adenylate cyclase/tetratricopeptide (TPR) repeat protein
MQCPSCGEQNRDDSRFCLQCGARLASRCPSCGRDLPAGARFCDGSGTALGAPADRDAASPRSVPGHLADKILRTRAAMEGERKHVTVLFGDVKGSMELVAERDPEEARGLLDGVLERMMEAIHRYDGTVNQLMGDGVMALFGAPLALEDHAVRACYAALRMQDSLRRYADDVHRSLGVPLHIRVGLNSGEVVVRSIGSDLRMEYSAIGMTTHLAARMEQMAMPGSVLLAPATVREAEGFVVVRPLGARPVKGLDSPIEVFELVGATTVRSRLQATAARGLTRFVGRDPEICELRQATARAAAGAGQVVAVVGEAGVGKSRLFWEFVHSVAAEGWRVVEGRSVSYGKTSSYLPLVELLKSYFAVEPSDEPRAVREKVTGKLLALDRGLEPHLAPLLWLLDVPLRPSDKLPEDPASRRRQTLDSIRALLIREAQVQPLAVVVEDLHWIDDETQELLDSLVDAMERSPLLLLVNYRPEYRDAWAGRSCHHRLTLAPLAAASARMLLTALLGESAELEPLRDLVRRHTDGNPFFIEETVRALVEGGALAGERGAYRLERAIEHIEIPPTAEAILATRIDRLSAQDKRLLQAAAVVGKDVPLSVLRSIVDEEEDRLRASLARLQAAEFLYEMQLFPELEYTFRHALGRDVAYRSVLAERKRALHARVVEAIESLFGDRLAEQAERLAEHAVEGQLWNKALVHLQEAGRRGAARSSNREAATAFERAVEVVERLPPDSSLAALEIDLRSETATVLFPLGELPRALGHLEAAEQRAAAIGDKRRLGRVSTVLANYFWAAGEPRRALDAARRALEHAEALADEDMRLVARFRLGQALHSLGEFSQAIGALRACVEGVAAARLAERFGLQFLLSVGARTWLVWCLAEVGDFADGARLGEEAMRIADEADHPLSRIVARHGLGSLRLRRGEFANAARTLEQGLELCRAASVVSWRPRLEAALGYAYAFQDRIAEARRLLEESERESADMRTRLFQAQRATWRSEVYWLAGDAERAERTAADALDVARRQGERGSEAWALRMVADIAAGGARAADAAGHYRQAMAIAGELGMKPLLAHCHLGLARLLRWSLDEAGAARELATAETLFREPAMRHWVAQLGR